jgi:DegV family protein with EDD domain
MKSIGILTDNSVQFTQPNPAYRGIIHSIPLHLSFGGKEIPMGEDYKVSSLPNSALGTESPQLLPPQVDEFHDTFVKLSSNYDHILGIFISSNLSNCYQNAVQAAYSLRGRVNIHTIDSQTISIGLGILVEMAAEAIIRGKPIDDVEHLIRSMVPHVYSILCTPSLSYLFNNGFIDLGQGLVGEMLNIYPIFTLEEGKLTPMEKAKGFHHTETFFQEFIDEFERLGHISIIQSAPPAGLETHAIRDHVHEYFPKTPFTTHTINIPTAALFGPRAVGLFVVESGNSKNL